VHRHPHRELTSPSTSSSSVVLEEGHAGADRQPLTSAFRTARSFERDRWGSSRSIPASVNNILGVTSGRAAPAERGARAYEYDTITASRWSRRGEEHPSADSVQVLEEAFTLLRQVVSSTKQDDDTPWSPTASRS